MGKNKKKEEKMDTALDSVSGQIIGEVEKRVLRKRGLEAEVP